MAATARSQTSEQGHARAVRFAIPASQSQLDFIVRLGGKANPDLTLGEANQYIRALKRKNNRTYFAEARLAREARAAERKASLVTA